MIKVLIFCESSSLGDTNGNVTKVMQNQHDKANLYEDARARLGDLG